MGSGMKKKVRVHYSYSDEKIKGHMSISRYFVVIHYNIKHIKINFQTIRSRFECRLTRGKFCELRGDIRLSRLVIGECEIIEDRRCVIGCRTHSHHAGGMLGGNRLKQRLVHLELCDL